MDAFSLVETKRAIVFPNSSNSILTSMQAGSLYKKAKISVLNCRSAVECYAALSVMDPDASVNDVISFANDTISNIYQFSVYHAVRDIKFEGKKISKNDFFALSSNKILSVSEKLDEVALDTIKKSLEKRECDLVTLFYGDGVADEYIEHIQQQISQMDYDIEIATVSTKETMYYLTVTFE